MCVCVCVCVCVYVCEWVRACARMCSCYMMGETNKSIFTANSPQGLVEQVWNVPMFHSHRDKCESEWQPQRSTCQQLREGVAGCACGHDAELRWDVKKPHFTQIRLLLIAALKSLSATVRWAPPNDACKWRRRRYAESPYETKTLPGFQPCWGMCSATWFKRPIIWRILASCLCPCTGP